MVCFFLGKHSAMPWSKTKPSAPEAEYVSAEVGLTSGRFEVRGLSRQGILLPRRLRLYDFADDVSSSINRIPPSYNVSVAREGLGEILEMIPLRFSLSSRGVGHRSLKRFFLSSAYKCEEAWANRLKNPAFRKIDASVLYHELDECFEKKIRVSVLDIDLLLNGLRDASYKNEMDDVLLRIRLCPESVLLPERTTHAAIRWYMDHASKADLFNVLSDRINYGLFPDYFLTNVLMDKYLKENDPRSAVKVAVLQMLQEDFGHPIMKALALHSCYKYLESPDIWESYREPEPDPDEEVVKVRVKYVRNAYFDDHFDITDTNHFVGKTLWLFGRSVDGAIGSSSELLGLVLYEKYRKCAELLDELIQKKTKVYAEAVEKATEYTLRKPKQAKVEGESEGARAEGDVEKKAKDEPEPADEWKIRVLESLKKVDTKNLVQGNLLSESAELVKRAVKENEMSDIRHQCQDVPPSLLNTLTTSLRTLTRPIYEQWEKDRENEIESEMKRANVAKLSLEIKEMKTELEMEEEKLFFFDREEEIKQLVKAKEQEKAQLVFFKEKGKQKQKDSYISSPQRKSQTRN